MGDMIPVIELAKMGVYSIKLEEGATIETRVLGNTSLIDHFISELKSSLPSGQVIGVDVKYSSSSSFFCIHPNRHPCLLILSTQSRCFIIQLHHKYVPTSLYNFLNEKSFCFVGTKSKLKIELKHICGIIFIERMRWLDLLEIGDVAARVLKNPGLIKCYDISKLAKEVGIPYQQVKMEGKWDAKVFSHEQVKAAITDAYTCYASVSKLFAML